MRVESTELEGVISPGDGNVRDALKICAAGGVTGGHLYPNLAVLEEIARRTKTDVLYVCVEGKLEDRLLPSLHPEYRRYNVKLVGLRRPFLNPLNALANVVALTRMGVEFRSVSGVMKEFQPKVTYVSGGYVSYPVAVASRKLRVPLFVQEQNSVPGKANLAISAFAERIFVSFEESVRYFPDSVRDRVVVSGNPIWTRNGVAEVPHPTVLVVGGSGGSEFLNGVAVELSHLMPDVHFVLSTGGRVLKGEPGRNLEVREYIGNLYAFWRAVDCAITRAGATTISELIHFNVPAVVVPWEGSAEGHQLLNAEIYERTGLGFSMRERDYDPKKMVQLVRRLIERGRTTEERENPAKRVADEVLGFLEG